MARELTERSGRGKVGEIRRKGLMAGIEIVADRGTGGRFPAGEKIGQRVVRKVRERGVILRPLGDVIVLMPPLSSSESEIEFLVRSASWAIEAVLGGGHPAGGGGGDPPRGGGGRDPAAAGAPSPPDPSLLREAIAPRLPLPEVCLYPLSAPLSPHLAARRDGVTIDTGRARGAIARC